MQRRTFLTTTSSCALGYLGLQKYLSAQESDRVISPYGDLVEDPDGILDLPEGFTYQIISKRGNTMDDGLQVPGMPDGMACFPGQADTVVLVRNHELGADAQKTGPYGSSGVPDNFDESLPYDHGKRGEYPHVGGTTNLVYDLKRGVVLREFLSLVGTDRNCAGGKTPWGTWVTCEEPADLTSPRGKRHGYCFEVKASDDGQLQKAVALEGLGRYRHEAIAVDPDTGIVYLTEDTGDGLIYRFIPKVKEDLSRGKLQALAIKGAPSTDLRNKGGSGSPVKEGVLMDIEWINLKDIDSPRNDLRIRGFEDGAARFARGEGIEYTNGSIYICCTDGGPQKQGQIYRFIPRKDGQPHDQLELFLQPSKSDLVTNGDNLCSAPWGDLIICEDLIAEHKSNIPHLRGITPDGRIYNLARNGMNRTEFAGSCFSPDGSVLFVNMQGLGLTLAIRGPWKERA